MERNNYTDLYTQYIKQWNLTSPPRSLLFNSIVTKKTVLNENPIEVYQVIPPNQPELFYKSVEINLYNPNITKLYLICNNLNLQRRLDHPKLHIIYLDNWIGVTYDYIFTHLKPTSINIILFDSVVLDLSSIEYCRHLESNEIGIFSSKLFIGDPLTVVGENFNISTKENPESSIDFNGFIINGTFSETLNYYSNFTGSTNLLLDKFYKSGYNIINISNIVISFLYNRTEQLVENNNNYIYSENFPFIFAMPQLSIEDKRNIVIDIEKVQKFIEAPQDIINYANITFESIQKNNNILSLIDKTNISEVEHILLHNFYLKYLDHFDTKTKELNDFLERTKQYQLSHAEKNIIDFETQEKQKLNDLFKESRIKITTQFEEDAKHKREKLEEDLLRHETSVKSELNVKYEYEYSKRMYELDSQLEHRQKNLYSDTDNLIKIYHESKMNDINRELSDFISAKKQAVALEIDAFKEKDLYEINLEHAKEKERLAVQLDEYAKYSRQKIEIELKQETRTRYELEYIKAIEDLHDRLNAERLEKTQAIDREIEFEKKNKNIDLQNYIIAKTVESEAIIEAKKQKQQEIAQQDLEDIMKRDKDIRNIQNSNEIAHFYKTEHDKKRIELDIFYNTEKQAIFAKLDDIFQTHTNLINERVKIYEKSEFTKIKDKLDQQEREEIAKSIFTRENAIIEHITTFNKERSLEFEAIHNRRVEELKASFETEKRNIDIELDLYKVKQMELLKTSMQEETAKEMEIRTKCSFDLNQTLSEIHDKRRLIFESELQIIKQTGIQEGKRNIIEELEKLNASLKEEYEQRLKDEEAKHIESMKHELQAKLEMLQTENKIKIDENREMLKNKLESEEAQYTESLCRYRMALIETNKAEDLELEYKRIENHNKKVKESQLYVASIKNAALECLTDEIEKSREQLKNDMLLEIQKEIQECKESMYNKMHEENQVNVKQLREEHMKTLESIMAQSGKEASLLKENQQKEIEELQKAHEMNITQTKESMKAKIALLKYHLDNEMIELRIKREKELEDEISIKREAYEREMKLRIYNIEKELSPVLRKK